VSSSHDDGEWRDAFRASAVPDLLAALSGCETEDILDLLGRRYASYDSETLEEIVRESEELPDLLARRYASVDSAELERLREEDDAMLRKFWSWPV
jgi:hypothetical protein